MASKAERLPALQSHDPVARPAAQDLVDNTPVVHECPTLSKRQVVDTAEVDHVADIEVSQRVVEHWAEAWDSIGAERVSAGTVQQVAGIAQRLRPGICEQECQAMRGLFL